MPVKEAELGGLVWANPPKQLHSTVVHGELHKDRGSLREQSSWQEDGRHAETDLTGSRADAESRAQASACSLTSRATHHTADPFFYAHRVMVLALRQSSQHTGQIMPGLGMSSGLWHWLATDAWAGQSSQRQ